MDHPILEILFRNHSNASKFAATCQSAHKMASNYIDHWDITRGNYNECEKDPKASKASRYNGTVGKVVVVTPFRVKKWHNENYKCDMYGLQNMSESYYGPVE